MPSFNMITGVHACHWTEQGNVHAAIEVFNNGMYATI
jgi:hypothetical protein